MKSSAEAKSSATGQTWQPEELAPVREKQKAAQGGLQPWSLEPLPAKRLSQAASPQTEHPPSNVQAFIPPPAVRPASPPAPAAAENRAVPQPPADPRCTRWMPGDLTRPRLSASQDDLQALKEKVMQEVLEKGQRQAEQQARQVLSAARQQADELLQAAQRSAGQVSAEAYQAGLAQAQADTRETLQLAERIVAETRLWREQLLQQSEPLVVHLVQDIARKLFGKGMVLEPEILSQTLQHAISEASTLGALRILANPEDVKVLGPQWPSQQMALTGQNIELVPSQDIQRGGCTIDGEFGSLDAQVKTQLGLVSGTFDSVLKERRSSPQAVPPFGQESHDGNS